MPKETTQQTKPIRRALTLDAEKYQRMLDAPETTDIQRGEMIDALWSIITAFVDLGFDIHPAENPCGQAKNCDAPPPVLPANVLEWDEDLTSQFKQTAANAVQEGGQND